MMKANIEGLEIAYKTVLDLNEKVRELLIKIKKEREECEAKFRSLRKREKSLEKFLGIYKEQGMNPPSDQARILRS